MCARGPNDVISFGIIIISNSAPKQKGRKEEAGDDGLADEECGADCHADDAGMVKVRRSERRLWGGAKGLGRDDIERQRKKRCV